MSAIDSNSSVKQTAPGEPGPRASAIIVAGGQSRRMGRDKAFIEFEGKPLVARVIERLQMVASEIIIVANTREEFEPFGLPIIGDVYPGKGSIGGIFTGLQAAREQYVLAVACDMPFLNERLLRHLISRAPGHDVVVPRAISPSSKGKRRFRGEDPAAREKPFAKESDLHPLHAVYAKSCLDSMRIRLEMNDLRVISFFESVNVRIVETEEVDRFDPKHLSFFNLNTPEDLQLALQLAR